MRKYLLLFCQPLLACVLTVSVWAAPGMASAPNLLWTKPAAWTEQAGGALRIATFRFTDGEATIVVLGGSGGGAVPNVNRWREQLGLAAETSENIEKALQTDKAQIGPFRWLRLNSGERSVLGAIMPAGLETVFVKLSSTKAAAEREEANFLALVRSLRRRP